MPASPPPSRPGFGSDPDDPPTGPVPVPAPTPRRGTPGYIDVDPDDPEPLDPYSGHGTVSGSGGEKRPPATPAQVTRRAIGGSIIGGTLLWALNQCAPSQTGNNRRVSTLDDGDSPNIVFTRQHLDEIAIASGSLLDAFSHAASTNKATGQLGITDEPSVEALLAKTDAIVVYDQAEVDMLPAEEHEDPSAGEYVLSGRLIMKNMRFRQVIMRPAIAGPDNFLLAAALRDPRQLQASLGVAAYMTPGEQKLRMLGTNMDDLIGETNPMTFPHSIGTGQPHYELPVGTVGTGPSGLPERSRSGSNFGIAFLARPHAWDLRENMRPYYEQGQPFRPELKWRMVANVPGTSLTDRATARGDRELPGGGNIRRNYVALTDPSFWANLRRGPRREWAKDNELKPGYDPGNQFPCLMDPDVFLREMGGRLSRMTGLAGNLGWSFRGENAPGARGISDDAAARNRSIQRTQGLIR